MNLIYFYLLFWITCGACYEVTNKVDFEKNCDVQMQVSDSAIVEVFAYPQAGVLPETSSCQAKFVATPSSRKLRIYVHEFFLGPGACGHKMKIYDGDAFQKDPTWELSCNTPLTTYTSSSNFVILSFTKPSVDTSQLYKFNIKITTDQDEPTLLFEALKTPDEHKLKWPAYRILQHRKRRQTENKPSYTAPLTGSAGGSSGGGLTSGAIAGIAVGGVVGAVIIIAICIYALWKFLRQSEEKSRYGASEPPPVFATHTSSSVNGILKHPGSGGSVRSKSTKSHGFDNDAFSDTSETRNSRFNEKPIGDRNDKRYDEESGRGSYSRRGRDKPNHDHGHQNQSYMDDDGYNRYDDRSPRSRQSYKEATGDRQHMNLSEVTFGGRGRKYGDESSRTESSFQTDTTNRTYSDSSRDGDGSVSLNPTGSKRYRRNEREGSIRRSRSRSMTSSQSAQTKRSQRSSSADRAEQTSQQGSHHGNQQRPQHHNNHHHHRGSSGSSRRKKQKPPDPYLPIFAETKKSKKKY